MFPCFYPNSAFSFLMFNWANCACFSLFLSKIRNSHFMCFQIRVPGTFCALCLFVTLFAPWSESHLIRFTSFLLFKSNLDYVKLMNHVPTKKHKSVQSKTKQRRNQIPSHSLKHLGVFRYGKCEVKSSICRNSNLHNLHY
jgi:hypothetical protein